MDITNVANLTNEEAAVLETKNIGIEGMTRECVRLIEKALRGKPGVRDVHVDPSRGIASVTFDRRQTSFPEIHDAILESGYPAKRTVPE